MLRREVPPRLDGAVATELGVDVIMAKVNRNNADIQRRLAGNLRIPKEDDIMFTASQTSQFRKLADYRV